ncbi:MAG: ABC transporter substrate-binding protein, partial [Muricoprocola sp.]
MKKQVLAKVLAVTMTAGLLSAVGMTAAAEEEVTLRFSWWGGDERTAATQEVIDQFQELHPNVTIEAEFGGSDGYHDKLSTSLASGTAADIVQVDPEIFPTYVANGDYFYDLNELGVDTSNFDENYISLEINGRYDGKQLGLPTGISGAGFIVNKDLAEEIGLDFTQDMTWDSLIEMGKKVQEYDPEMYLLSANKEYLVNLVVFNYGKQLVGGTLIDPETKEIKITQEQLEEVYSYIKALYDNKVVAPASYQASYSGDELQNDVNWINGKYVANLTYISTMDVMVAANPDATYYAGKLPVLEGATEAGWASNTPQVLAITKNSEHPEVAAE